MKKEEITNKEKNPSPKGNIIFTVLILCFFAVIGSVSLLIAVTPDKDFSQNENRVLASKPVLTFQSIYDGSFMKKTEAYLADQFPMRDAAIYVKSFSERLLGKNKENGAYIGKDGYLFDTPADPDKEKLIAIIKAVNSFADENDDIYTYFTLVPNSTYIYADKLPDNTEFKNQKVMVKNFYKLLSDDIGKINAVTALEKASQESQVFYMTDHHWTTRGAFSVFFEIAKALELDADANSYKFYTVSDSFKGTLSSKVTSSASADVIEICVPTDESVEFFIDFGGEKNKRSSFFFEEKLKEKNQYELFLGGNYSKVTITTNLQNDRKLLIIKDSYANCLIPMLTPYFSKITVIDPRYMTESVDSILQEDSYTEALFLYNVNTLLQDTSLKDVL